MYSGVDIFVSRIVCGECGAYYGSKVWHSNQAKYRQVIYRCNENIPLRRVRTQQHQQIALGIEIGDFFFG